MIDRLRFLLNRVLERLWVKPLLMCVVSLLVVFLAKGADLLPAGFVLPVVALGSVETLLRIQASSMLVIATFAVGSMVASYASASNSATPRSFPLVVSDDVSQNALSTFIGAFIFSLVSLVFLQNGFYEGRGIFAVLVLTISTFAIVVLTFIRWVDRIARLGRLGETIDTVEKAASRSLVRRRAAPTLGGAPVGEHSGPQRDIRPRTIGYVQRIEIDRLQAVAARAGLRIVVHAMPGTFASPDRRLATVIAAPLDASESEGEGEGKGKGKGKGEVDVDVLDEAVVDDIVRAFRVGHARTFDEDPRFGLIALSEIAGRAMSPAVNDPGTAIGIVGAMVRLFTAWAAPLDAADEPAVVHDRVEIPELHPADLLEDAFTATARDGAGSVEVAVRLQKALASLASLGHAGLRRAAIEHSRTALQRCEQAMPSPSDLDAVRRAAAFSRDP